MTKEEQINEMAQEILQAGVALEGSDFAHGLFDEDDHFHRLAKELFDAGYRKADKVREETARQVIKPYSCERFGKNGQTYSLKCGRCNKTVQTKWNYCPFCGVKLREVK